MLDHSPVDTLIQLRTFLGFPDGNAYAPDIDLRVTLQLITSYIGGSNAKAESMKMWAGAEIRNLREIV